MSLAEMDQRAQELKMMDYVATLLDTHRLRVLFRRMEQMDEYELERLGMNRDEVRRAIRYGRPRPI